MTTIQIASKYQSIQRHSNGATPRFLSSKRDFTSFHNRLVNQFSIGRLKDVPAYKTDSRARDSFLQEWRLKETLMAGVLNSVVNIDANRGWAITSGRNLVNKWSNRIKNESANSAGWRHFAKKSSLSFWSTDMGNIVGTRREPPFAVATQQDQEIVINKTQLLALENIDPAKCYLRNKIIDLSEDVEGFVFDVHSRLTYKQIPLMEWDYFRVASMIQDTEGFNDLGFCALSRAIEFTRIMYAVWMHDLEQLDARMPKGLLFLQGIDEDQWDTAMDQRDEDLDAKGRQFYGGLKIFTGIIAPDSPNMDAKLVALSQLPSGFDMEKQVNTMMAGYALCFGYDPREFWPVSQGSLGTGRETEAQAEKATSKGQGDWALSFQENLQRELPSTVHFEFQERNEAGELLAAQVDKAKAEVIDQMGKLRESSIPVLTNDEIRQLWSAQGLIPDDWTFIEEPVTATDEEDTDDIRERLLEYPKIRAACEMHQNEPIVQYQWRSDKPDKIIELWPTGYDATKKKMWLVNRALYSGDDWQLTKEDIINATTQ